MLFHCPSIKGLWEGLLSILDIAWVRPFLIKDLITGWNFFPIGKKARKLWRGQPPFVFFGQFGRRGTV